MTLDELKERFSSEAKQVWDKVQDSSVYNQLRDRYENLTPTMQKVALFGSIAAITAIVLSFPYTSYTHSNENVTSFEDKRATIRELLKVSRESAEVPNIPEPPSADILKSMADNQMKNANLLPEQIKSVEVASPNSKLIPQSMVSGALNVTLAKLNLRQVIDLGYQLQAINPSVKMQDLTMTANREDARYFDVVYRLVALAVPSAEAPGAPEPSAAPAAPSRAGRPHFIPKGPRK